MASGRSTRSIRSFQPFGETSWILLATWRAASREIGSGVAALRRQSPVSMSSNNSTLALWMWIGLGISVLTLAWKACAE